MSDDAEHKPISVLLVEDNPVDARLIEAFLAKTKWVTFEVQKTAELATAIERTTQSRIDIILLDLNLTDSEGLETLYALQVQVPELPKVIITGDDSEEQALDALREGAQDYLVKGNLNVNQLMRSIHYAIERKEAEEELRLAKIEAETAGWYLHEANEKLTHEITERKRLEEEHKKMIELLSESNQSLEKTNKELDRVNEKLKEHEKALIEANEKLEIQATTDPLTQLFNRRQGEKILKEEMARVQRGKQVMGVIMVDLDHFKSVNDTYGHDGGDAVLVDIAARLKRSCREYDSVVRWGGEELLIICPHTNSSQVVMAAERLRKLIADRPVEKEGLPAIPVTASMGTAGSDAFKECDLENLLTLADTALYRAKAEGRNCVRSASVEPPELVEKESLAQSEHPQS